MADLVFFAAVDRKPLPLVNEFAVVRQFTPSFVSRADGSDRPIFVLRSGEPLQLLWEPDVHGFVLGSDLSGRLLREIRGSSGLIHCYEQAGPQIRVLRPALKVEPASLNPADHRAIISRLRHIALFQNCPMQDDPEKGFDSNAR